MSASRFPWSVLGLTPAATEKEVRRAYATRLKQLDTAENPEAFQELRSAYEMALMMRRTTDIAAGQDHEEVVTVQEDFRQQSGPELRDAEAVREPEPDLTLPFKTMHELVEDWDYSVGPWQQLLNDPLLDDPHASAAFEFALVEALSENELKSEFALSAGEDWQELIESRYAWVSDGIRYARLFPLHADLRRELVKLGRPYTPEPPQPSQFAGLGKVGLVLFLLYLVIRLVNRAAEGGVTP